MKKTILALALATMIISCKKETTVEKEVKTETESVEPMMDTVTKAETTTTTTTDTIPAEGDKVIIKKTEKTVKEEK